MKFTVDAGPKNAKTDASGLRYYTWQGIEYPSVTTIRRLAGMPHGLHQWSMGKVIDRVMNEPEELNRLAEVDEKEARKWLRRAATEERDLAADKGSRVHWAAQSGLAESEVEDDIRYKVKAYLDFLRERHVRVLWSERQVWNLAVGYAGTADLLADLDIGRYVIDIKTGKNVYVEHALQIEAYARGEFVGEDDVVDFEASDLLTGGDVGRAVLHLTDAGWALYVLNASQQEATWRAFKGLREFGLFSSAVDLKFLFTRLS